MLHFPQNPEILGLSTLFFLNLRQLKPINPSKNFSLQSETSWFESNSEASQLLPVTFLAVPLLGVTSDGFDTGTGAVNHWHCSIPQFHIVAAAASGINHTGSPKIHPGCWPRSSRGDTEIPIHVFILNPNKFLGAAETFLRDREQRLTPDTHQ